MSLENCEVEKDILGFIKTFGTGQEIPDPPRYINFCKGDIDSASEMSEDDSYSVAQFSRTTNPAFRTSSPVHPNIPQDARSQRMSEEPIEEINVSTPTNANSNRPRPLNYKQQEPNVPPNYSPSQHGEVAKIPHNEYPTEGMTMFCRAGPPSQVGSALSSNTRPPSRDSQSEYSNPSSYTSAEPMSGKSSPTKGPPVNGVQMPGMGPESPDKTVQKKRSGFFSNSPFNSPFRRKSKRELNHEAGRQNWNASSTKINLTPSNVSNSSTQSSPTKSPVRQTPFNRNAGNMAPEGEEPADPRATFQLNIGQNVLDVNNPDSHQSTPRASVTNTRRGGAGPLISPSITDEHDPIARALADLKQSSHGSNLGMTKQASTRQPVDNYHRVKTPAPDQSPAIRPGSNQDIRAAQRGTPPPAYDPAAAHRRAESALGVPQPAFTSKEMRSRTEKWGMGSSVSAPPSNRPSSSMGRPASRDGRRSPAPGASGVVPRALSPQPQFSRNGAQSPGPAAMRNGARSPGPQPNGYQRSPSPNPYAGNPGRPRGGTQSTPQGRPQTGPGMEMQLARYDDQSQHHRQQQHQSQPHQQPQPQSQQQRYPPSAGGSGRSRTGMMPSPAPSGNRPASSYGDTSSHQRNAPPTSYDQSSARGRPQDPSMDLRRERSKSVAGPMTSYAGNNSIVPAGRSAPLHYGKSHIPKVQRIKLIPYTARAMYTYSAAIPEELSFSKGDILAVLRMQDDGWWEAEVSRSVKGGNVGVGGVGLVPSNYLQRC